MDSSQFEPPNHTELGSQDFPSPVGIKSPSRETAETAATIGRRPEVPAVERALQVKRTLEALQGAEAQ